MRLKQHRRLQTAKSQRFSRKLKLAMTKKPFDIREAYEILGNLRGTSAGLVALSLVAGYDPEIFIPNLY